MVTLFHPAIAPDGREFEQGHADRLMAMSDNGGWTYPENNQDANIGTGNTRKTKSAKKPRVIKTGD